MKKVRKQNQHLFEAKSKIFENKTRIEQTINEVIVDQCYIEV